MSSEYDAPDRRPCPYPDYDERGYRPEDLPATGEGTTGVERAVWDALYAVEDPEMPVSVVDLGLVYGVRVTPGDGEDAGARATIDMTLTYTGCPARDMLQEDVRRAATSVDGVERASVELVWSPEWSIDMVTEQGKADLREFGLSV